jgi:hypothetical protein
MPRFVIESEPGGILDWCDAESAEEALRESGEPLDGIVWSDQKTALGCLGRPETVFQGSKRKYCITEAEIREREPGDELKLLVAGDDRPRPYVVRSVWIAEVAYIDSHPYPNVPCALVSRSDGEAEREVLACLDPIYGWRYLDDKRVYGCGSGQEPSDERLNAAL